MFMIKGKHDHLAPNWASTRLRRLKEKPTPQIESRVST
jgi:hypothetical protein